ncbi:MAG: ATP-binding protein [Asticcacaulis sp.]
MSNINIKRAVDNIRSGTNAYTPIIELVVNAIQAIEAAKVTNGRIEIRIIREGQNDMLDTLKPVDGFVVTDNGIGFNKVHRDSFDTLYTAEKADYGGKGFGRFTCLKYFEQFDVHSIFSDGDALRHRSFSMGTENDIIINEQVVDIDVETRSTSDVTTGTNIKISKIKGVKFPDKNLDIIARVLVEKLLPYFIDKNNPCPLIVIGDENEAPTITLNDYLKNEDNQQIVELTVPNGLLEFDRQGQKESFEVRVFKFYSPRTQKSKISLVAHRREVTDITLQSYIPEFADEFYDKGGEADGRDKNYIIKAYVFGNYLDENVSLERGTFNFQKESDLILGVSQNEIEAAAANVAREAVGVEISARKERKKTRIDEYVANDAPWHRLISQDADFSSLPMNPSPQEIEIHLQRAKFEKEINVRREVAEILANTETDELKQKVVEVVDKISQTSKNDLIHYVSMRKCVLDLFSKTLEIDEDGKYSSEADVHDIIMPRKKDSDELDYEQHNLWILDERLNFASYVASEKPIGNPKGKRPTLLYSTSAWRSGGTIRPAIL